MIKICIVCIIFRNRVSDVLEIQQRNFKSLCCMSTAFNFDASGVAGSYDKIRSPMGADVVAGLLHVHCGKPLKVSHLPGYKISVFIIFHKKIGCLAHLIIPILPLL